MDNDQCAAASRAPGPFARGAILLLAAGLAPIPMRGKQPVIKGFNRWNGPPSQTQVERWRNACGHLNIGIVTGRASGVVVLDLDGADAFDRMKELQCPFVVQTGKGYHLWYRYQGQGNADLRQHGLDADLKGDGGVVVAPPSVHATGRIYTKIRGTLADVLSLPALPDHIQRLLSGRHSKAEAGVKEGQRNTSLFKSLLREARSCDDFDALLDCARTINEGYMPPMSDPEVVRTAKSAWDYECGGRNWAGLAKFGGTTMEEMLSLSSNPDALALLTYLRCQHSQQHVFSISPKPLAKRFTWGDHRRVSKARDQLVRGGYLKCLHKGGTRQGDASKYQLVLPSCMNNLGRGGNPPPIEYTCSSPSSLTQMEDQGSQTRNGTKAPQLRRRPSQISDECWLEVQKAADAAVARFERS